MENVNSSRKLSDRIKTLLGEKSGKYDIFFVLLLYAAGVAVRYFLGSFPKKIDTYCDELLYYTIAQSIHDGNGIMCMNAHTGFTKVAYSFVISPLFGIADPMLRVKMITLLNSALILSSAIFVYLIGRELGLNRGNILLTLVISLMWPDMSYSMTVMSENLNWPLVTLAIFLWLKSKKSRYFAAYSIGFGAVCYAGYLCKDIFFALLLSAVLFEAAFPVVSYLISRKESGGKRLREYFDKRSLTGCGIALAVFAVCYFLGNRLLFGSAGGTNVAGAISSGMGRLVNLYTILYFLYAFVYYLAAALIAVLVMPVAYSAASFKSMDDTARKIFSFLIVYLTVSCGMIAFTISINEDIGSISPRLHLRYMGFILLLLIVVFFRVLQTKSDTGDGHSRAPFIFTIAAALVVCVFFHSPNDSLASIDQSALNVYNSAEKVLMGYTGNVGEKVFYLIKPVSFAVFAVIIFVVHYFKDKKKAEGSAAAVFALFMIMLCFRNSGLETEQYRRCLTANEEMISSVNSINHYLDSADEDTRVAYICSSRYSGYQKTFTTYYNHIGKTCEIYEKELPDYTADGRVVDVPNTDFELTVSSFTFTYDRFDGFDYIITDRDCKVALVGLSPVEDAGGGYFTLYKNDDPATVEIIPDAYFGEPLEITFSEDNEDMESYCVYGLDTEGESYSMTNSDRAGFNIPVIGEYDSAEVSVRIAETFGNAPQRYIIIQDNEIISEGVLTGAGEIRFSARVNDGSLKFDLVCPTAVSVGDEELSMYTTGMIVRRAFVVSGVTVR